MKTKNIVAVAAFLTILLMVSSASGEVPRLINFQGNLTDFNGAPITGTRDMTFRIYDDATVGTLLWQETQQDVSISHGIFNVILGITDWDPVNRTGGVDLAFGADYWLSVEIDADGEMTPRAMITSVGYAYRADTVDGFHASATATPNQLLALDANGRLPADITGDADTVDGLHADAFITNETDPVYSADPASGIAAADIANWNTVNWGELAGIPADIADGDQVGVADHGALTGLGDDDHPQYLTQARHATIDANLGEEAPGDTTRGEPTRNEIRTWGQLDDGNPAEEAPGLNTRGEPTGTEIRQWADDITSWGHGNTVTNLNADTVDGQHASELGGVFTASYDSGWFAVTTNSTYVKSHGLGSVPKIVQVFVAQNSDGSGWCIRGQLQMDSHPEGEHMVGCAMTALSTSSITVRTFQFVAKLPWGPRYWSSGYAKVIAVK